MKKLFILAVAITSSLLFVQCKKTETLVPQEEVVTTVKSLSSDLLTGTSWEVVSVVSVPNNISLSWNIKYPKFTFNSGIVEMKLGRDLCTKEYLSRNNKFIVAANGSCPISNPDHTTLYNLFDGEFELIFSATDPNELVIKSFYDTVVTLKKVNTLSTSDNVSELSVD
jgi:hypothetical protein